MYKQGWTSLPGVEFLHDYPPPNAFDRVLAELEHALRTSVGGGVRASARKNPAASPSDEHLDEAARQEAARLMRVNHAGEIGPRPSTGQAFMAGNPRCGNPCQSSAEEIDHLACANNACRTGGSVSKLDPSGTSSFAIAPWRVWWAMRRA